MADMKVSELLAHNIKLMREEEGFIEFEKSMIADALYGILSAKIILDDEPKIQDKLETASQVVMQYLSHIDMFVEE